MKHFMIWRNDNCLEIQLYAKNGKQALQHFLKEYVTHTSIYSIHKSYNHWIMYDCCGNYWKAIEGRV